MKTIIQKLEVTPNDYENIIWLAYNKWCQGVTNNDKEFQQVLANSSINSWFRIELTKCEADFLERTHLFTDSNVTAKDFNRCYTECLYKLFTIRPMPLLRNIVKPKPKGIPAFSALNFN